MPLTDVDPQVKARQSQAPLRLAVIGCGAVAQEVHLPVLAGHDGISLQALVDRNQKAAASLAAAYRVPVVATDLGELDYKSIDAVLIATPPYHHAPCALEAIRHGLHVFVEKPMAVSLADAEATVKAAREAGVVLVVGVFRRLFSSTRMMQALLASGQFGQPLQFDAEEGHIYDWSCASLGSMRKDLAGGGVLSDTGAHTLDQVLSFFTGPAELLSYQDNARSGIESDCVLRLRVYHQGKPVEGRVELSRTRQLRNTFRVETDRGILEFATKERGWVTFQPHDLRLVDPAHGQMRAYENQWSWTSLPEPCLGADIRAEFEDWLTAIQTGQTPVLSGESVLPTVRITEECYRSAQPLEEPWAKSTLISPPVGANQAHSNGTPAVPTTVRVAAPAGRMLVTGASGFIGGRLVELLESQPGLELRALVHNPGSVSRLARLPVEMCLGDLRSREDLSRAVAGCDTVVHCAYGSSGTDRESWATTVDGTRNLVKAARQAGVKRFVHLSTIAVYGLRGTGTLDETTPPHPEAEPYSQAKTAAEKVVGQAAHEGLCATILRLANVYGPFSMPYAVRPVQHLREGLPVFVGRGETPSNTVFVD
ncbi:MAG TPA: NAD-dependent epimerase/dehydratase family protein, partial [Gemmataceae bacterium]|nr:NAD-dependent epimerase/dehydratase family protein [Gemmataceae bacterium]